MPAAMNVVIDISARDAQRDAYSVQLEQEGQVIANTWAHIDLQALLEHEYGDAHDYGMELYDAVFLGALGRAYQRVIGEAGAETAVRIQLVIHPDAPELHALPWERMFHILDDEEIPLAASAQTPFSRFLGGASRQPSVQERPWHLLLATANPMDSPEGCPSLDVAGEVASLADLVASQSGRVLGTLLPGRSGLPEDLYQRLKMQDWTIREGVTSWQAIQRELPGQHILHILAHGQFKRGDAPGGGTAYLLLEHEGDHLHDRGTLDCVADEDIAVGLRGVDPLPQLIFLAACDSAKRPPVGTAATTGANPFVGLAPRLMKAGTPAVVAMQDEVPIDLAHALAADFYRRLFEHGEVDRALSEARSLVYKRGQFTWAVPVLFLSRPDGQLFVPPQQSVRRAGPLRAYILCASGDVVAATPLYDYLKACEIKPWLLANEENLPLGYNVAEKRESSDAILVYISPNALQADGHLNPELREVVKEVQERNATRERITPIVPVLIYEHPLPEELRDWRSVRIDVPEGYSEIVPLLADLAKQLEAPPPSEVAMPLSLSRRQLPSQLIIQSPVHVEFTLVPACMHLMGSKEGTGWDTERPCCTVPLGDFYMGKYPVTVDQFGIFVGARGYSTTAEKLGYGIDWAAVGSVELNTWLKIPDASWHHPYGPDKCPAQGDHPVTQVSWQDATEFCRWLSEQTHRKVTLPSEAQWDRAARGPRLGEYPWGDRPPDQQLCNYARFVDRTTPVGQYSPGGDSYYGCADMAGNVWELTRSLYKDYPYVSTDGREDPTGKGWRAVRGGSYHGVAVAIRASVRDYDNVPVLTAMGFRVAIIP